MEGAMAERLQRNGIEITHDDGRWTRGKMAVTGGFVSFSAIICDDPDPEYSLCLNGGRILKLFWNWSDLDSNGQLCVPDFDRGWNMQGPFIPLDAYGESLDCLNKLLVAVGDRPLAERYVDIKDTALQGSAAVKRVKRSLEATQEGAGTDAK